MSREHARMGAHGGGVVESVVDLVRAQWQVFQGDRLGTAAIVILAVFILLGLAAPVVAPYEPTEKHRTPDGDLRRLEPPSLAHPLGTTSLGRDVLSQVIVGIRVSLIVGFLAAFFSVVLGTSIGIVSGYYGGWIEDILMRITDIVYGVPFLPFIIVLVILIGSDLFNIIVAISLVMWRSTARVIRSQVLTIKERPYIESTHAIGASDLRIMARHLLPNVMPLMFLYGAFSVAFAILTEASVSFLGFGDPNLISWGKMIFEAYNHNVIDIAWWWVIPPGLSIGLLTVSVFLVARTYEKVVNPEIAIQE